MDIGATIDLPDSGTGRASLLLPSPRPDAPKATLPGRIVSLASLSPAIPGRLLVNSLARAVVSETGAAVLVVDLEPDTNKAAVSLRDFALLQPALNGEFCFAERLLEGDGGFK